MIKQKYFNKLPIQSLMLALVIALMLSMLTACITEESTEKRPMGGGDVAPRNSKDTPVDNERRFDVRLQLALAYYQDGSSTHWAMIEVDKALELQPRSAEATALKGMIYDQMGDTANALTHFKKAADLEPNNGDYQHNYGTALCNYKRFSEGISYLEKALGMPNNTNKVRSWVAIGNCYKDAGDIQKAESAFHQALNVDPRNGLALFQLADFMYMRNDIQGAKYYLDQLGGMGNLNAQALWLGIKIARQQGDAYLMGQYAKLLRERYPNSTQAAALNRGDYNS